MIYPFFIISPWAWLGWFFGVSASRVLPAGTRDAEQLAALHAAAFRRGWSAEEFERLLIEHNVVADRAMSGASVAGFVISRLAGDQAEILSIAVSAPHRRRGLARKLLDVHLRRLATYGISVVFLEVDERNTPARRLYAGLRFHEVGRRESYYVDAGAETGTALVLRRDLP
ncbi:MAG TPA: GNAT family N-acetyltransferase [Xanthobacteraceae bacterium]|nr:GNAT family N-acetyltransferase [Xanthobacteraceae bacterium]